MLRQDRLDRIAREASEQSGRGSVPQIDQRTEFSSAISSVDQFNHVFFCDGSGVDFVSTISPNTGGSVAIFVGPEGGWSIDELKAVEKTKNVTIVSLGKLVLRAETAAIVSTYLFSR